MSDVKFYGIICPLWAIATAVATDELSAFFFALASAAAGIGGLVSIFWGKEK